LNGSGEGETLIRTAWQAKTGLHIGAFLPAFERGPGACDRLFDGSFAGLPAGSTSLERMITIRHRAKLSKGDEMAALQKADEKLNLKPKAAERIGAAAMVQQSWAGCRTPKCSWD
jgi:hypothetical protein